ncbi:MAG: phosphotransferase [Caldilineaceae bacterium]
MIAVFVCRACRRGQRASRRNGNGCPCWRPSFRSPSQSRWHWAHRPRYPYPWAIYNWIEGLPYRDELIRDEREAALDLVKFIGELRQINVAGRRAGRRPLHELDALTRTTIASLRDEIDGAAVSTVWEDALAASPWDGQPVWIHGDLLRSNLLVQHGRLCAVIDFGSVGVGDPAMDVVPAWSVFHRAGRAEAFGQPCKLMMRPGERTGVCVAPSAADHALLPSDES